MATATTTTTTTKNVIVNGKQVIIGKYNLTIFFRLFPTIYVLFQAENRLKLLGSVHTGIQTYVPVSGSEKI